METEQLEVMLRSWGMRITPQRVAVLEAVRQGGSPLSAEEIYEKVRQQIPHISLATVYKALGELRRIGQLRVLPVSGKLRFEAGLGTHCHLICQRCRRVEDVRGHGEPALPRLPEEKRRGFEILGVEVAFWGICPTCRQPMNGKATRL